MWVMKYSKSSYQVKHLEAHISSSMITHSCKGMRFLTISALTCSGWRGENMWRASSPCGQTSRFCYEGFMYTLKFMCSSSCVFIYMSVLVCMYNEAAQPHIYIQALTVHLFVSVTAPWWLLFSPSWGGKGEVMCWGSLAGKRVVGRRLVPQWCSSFRDSGRGEERATQWEVNWRYCCQSTCQDEAPQVFRWPKSHSLFRYAHHLMKRKRSEEKQEKWSNGATCTARFHEKIIHNNVITTANGFSANPPLRCLFLHCVTLCSGVETHCATLIRQYVAHSSDYHWFW